jgi:hypothetical protein
MAGSPRLLRKLKYLVCGLLHCQRHIGIAEDDAKMTPGEYDLRRRPRKSVSGSFLAVIEGLNRLEAASWALDGLYFSKENKGALFNRLIQG